MFVNTNDCRRVKTKMKHLNKTISYLICNFRFVPNLIYFFPFVYYFIVKFDSISSVVIDIFSEYNDNIKNVSFYRPY